MPRINYIRVSEYAELSEFSAACRQAEFADNYTMADFEREYDDIYGALVEALSGIGDVDEHSDNGDFSMSKYVPLRSRSISVVATSAKGATPETIKTMLQTLERLEHDYTFCLEVPKAFVCVAKDGRVMGYTTDGSNEPLKRLGFPD
jgi:hypothetical protein